MTSAKGNDVERILVVRYGEVALKGMNKPYFERVLEGRVRKALDGFVGADGLKTARSDGLIVVSGFGDVRGAAVSAPPEGVSPGAAAVDGAVPPGIFSAPVSDGIMGECIRRVSRVFGVASVSPAVRMESREMEDVSAVAAAYASGVLNAKTREGRETAPLTFKIFAKRSDKSYPINSPELAAKVGEAVLKALGPAVKVDVKDPELRLTVHLRRSEVFIYDEKVDGFGGLPLGTNGKGMVLLSGGIDSPVAAWLMAKRGMRVETVHYHSYPYTSGRARDKVVELASILAGYCGEFRMHVVNLLPAQERIAEHCPEEHMTILVRRFMMRIAEDIAKDEGCNMLVTGECLGQVASQTAESLFVTDAVCNLPVMRPLIALDKTDIIDLAREIGTYEKSIEPYEDCCTVFLPKHPATKPKLPEIEIAESAIPDISGLISELIKSKEVLEIMPVRVG
ncbi:MAG: tRNA 4-thiouridine(8) synthase ThiI [Clostridiales Family XIII bacterium]|jgi:thiamine biosynthesis protein ThiI|nr:tRNA 4-thiouridine(8) synthase ThiI [Clostridiales Family XIII bacterium]